jgi:hypothetical protein
MPKLPQTIDRGVTRISPRLCPHCGYHFDAVGTADGSVGTPVEGDITVCLNCAEVLVFETVDRLRKLTSDEQAALKDDPDWLDMRDAQAKLRAMQRQGFRTGQAERGSGGQH